MLIVFDLDGTLVDSLRDLTDASNELLAGYDAAPLDDIVVGRMVGEGAAALVSRLLEARGVTAPRDEALARFLALYDRRLVNHTRPYAGIVDALDRLKEHSALAVLTNKPSAAADRILSALGLRRYFEWVVGGDGPHGRKPNPDGLRSIMVSAGQQPEQTTLVGDSTVDVQTALNGRTRMCVARYGFGFRNCPPEALSGQELLVDDPRQLPDVLLTSGTGCPYRAKGSS